MTLQFQQHPQGIVIPLKVVAGSSRRRILGPYGDRLKVAVGAAPEKGKANRDVIALMAETLKVPKKDLAILSGGTSPEKKLLVIGLAEHEIHAKLDPGHEK